MPPTLSKSDFKLAQTCITKLYYKENHYPDTRDDNEYLLMLADGGYMIEQLARLRYPEGVELSFDGSAEANALLTAEALTRPDVTLFEATLLSGRKQARVDILRRNGNHFDLIEVKSKSYDSVETAGNPAGPFRSKTKRNGIYPLLTPWIPYLEDVTFQVQVLQGLHPTATITPYLILVDKGRTTSVEGLPGLFEISRNVEVNGRKRSLDVRYTGDRATPAPQEFLSLIDVTGEVLELMPAVRAETARFVSLYQDDQVDKVQAEISWECRSCEFRLNGGLTPNGWSECWGKLAEPVPHIFDLYTFGSNKLEGERLADIMIRQGRTRLLDVDPAQLVKKDGSPTTASVRQTKQIEIAVTQETWVGKTMRPTLDSWSWPLHFMDFETSALAVPYHAGMRPQEVIGFQWSSHSLAAPGAELVHREWLNTRDSWPCLEFVESLREAIGHDGRVLMWTGHEKTTLIAVRDQLTRYSVGDAAILEWITTLIDQRLTDMNRLCLEAFMHPGMGGRTSIKVVLDALWKTDPIMRDRFSQWMGDRAFTVQDDASPYQALPAVSIAGVDLDVSDGTGAMQAYQAMLYGAERDNPQMVAAYRDLLLRYCKLDTLAMVLIWDHWQRVAH